MAIDLQDGQARILGLAVLAAGMLAGGCNSTSAAGPAQPVAKQPQPQLEMLNRLNSMEAELARLRNTVEIQQNELTRLRERQSEIYDDIDSRLRSAETRASGGYGTGYAPVAPVADADIPPAPAAPSGSPAAAAAVSTAAVAQAASGQEQQEYDDAFNLLKQSRYEEAVTAFKEFLNRYPRSALADSAQYWIAEARYVNQAFDAALNEYNTLIQRYPTSRKLPDAMLKVGYIHYDNQQWKAARRALNAVTVRYPGTRVAVSAQQRLDLMEKQGH